MNKFTLPFPVGKPHLTRNSSLGWEMWSLNQREGPLIQAQNLGLWRGPAWAVLMVRLGGVPSVEHTPWLPAEAPHPLSEQAFFALFHLILNQVCELGTVVILI